VRDRVEIAAVGFPVFARGTWAQDQAPRGKVIDFRVTLRIGQAVVAPGDLLFGDDEGVVVIPRAAEAEAIEAALAKAATENAVAAAIRDVMSAREAFATFGVL
jgi:regulator of RNase E activity RraA